MKPLSVYFLITTSVFFLHIPASDAQQDSSKVRVIMIGAHPDDCDLNGGGTAALFASMAMQWSSFRY
jgi:hypothetical protein